MKLREKEKERQRERKTKRKKERKKDRKKDRQKERKKERKTQKRREQTNFLNTSMSSNICTHSRMFHHNLRRRWHFDVLCGRHRSSPLEPAFTGPVMMRG
jgi:hypothetical protein